MSRNLLLSKKSGTKGCVSAVLRVVYATIDQVYLDSTLQRSAVRVTVVRVTIIYSDSFCLSQMVFNTMKYLRIE